MEFTNAQLAKMVAAKTTEELKKAAESEKIDLSDEEAEYYFGLISASKSGVSEEDDLEEISNGLFAGCNEGWIKPKYKVGQKIIWNKGKSLSCFGTVTAVSKRKRFTPEGGWEWTYSLDLGRGWTERYVYESEISPW